jgi:hypothetical protein
MENETEYQRRVYHCAYMPRARWLEPSAPSALLQGMPLEAPSSIICPGSLIRRPEIDEASRALRWADRGQLREFYGGQEPTPLLMDCIDILQGGINATESATNLESLRPKQEGV